MAILIGGLVLACCLGLAVLAVTASTWFFIGVAIAVVLLVVVLIWRYNRQD